MRGWEAQQEGDLYTHTADGCFSVSRNEHNIVAIIPPIKKKKNLWGNHQKLSGLQAQPDPTTEDKAISSELGELSRKENCHQSQNQDPAAAGAALFQQDPGAKLPAAAALWSQPELHPC